MWLLLKRLLGRMFESPQDRAIRLEVESFLSSMGVGVDAMRKGPTHDHE